jgi:hypothetical protein
MVKTVVAHETAIAAACSAWRTNKFELFDCRIKENSSG